MVLFLKEKNGSSIAHSICKNKSPVELRKKYKPTKKPTKQTIKHFIFPFSFLSICHSIGHCPLFEENFCKYLTRSPYKIHDYFHFHRDSIKYPDLSTC